MTDTPTALRASVDRLAALVGPLDDEAITGSAYPSAWTIADVLSHLGSGAVISARRIEDSLAGVDTPDDFNPSVWDEWNAKSPRAQVDDALAADARLLELIGSTPVEDRARFRTAFGPVEVDWDTFVAMRNNEHQLHEWDVDVALHPDAVLDADGAEAVLGGLAMIAGFAARPEGDPRRITVATTDGGHVATVDVGADGVRYALDEGAGDDADVTMPVESFVRLVYGRLDPDHTPDAVTGDAAALDQLRRVFPGF